MTKETYLYGKRDLFVWKRDLLKIAYLRYASVSKETYLYGKEVY